MKMLPKEEAKRQFDDLIQTNPDLAKEVSGLASETKLDYKESFLKSLGVENGQRAKYVVEELNKLTTKEEKRDYFQNLIDKKVITKQVGEQISELLSQEIIVTSRESEGFPFPDYKEYSGGDRIRGDLNLKNNTDSKKKTKIDVILISPSGKRIETPQEEIELNPKESIHYGLEAQQLPKDVEKGQWQFIAKVGNKEIKTFIIIK